MAKKLISQKRRDLFERLGTPLERQERLNQDVDSKPEMWLRKYCRTMKIRLPKDISLEDLKLLVLEDALVEAPKRNEQFLQTIRKRAAAYETHGERFKEIFGVPLNRFYPSHFLGVNITLLQDQVIKSGPDESVIDVIRARYGDEAMQIINDLL